jgi:hypothetical protein
MRKLASCAILLLLILPARGQVITEFEINDPGARRLQQQYLQQLNAIGQEVEAHKFPYPFYFSRLMDIDEKQQQKVDQRSIRFEKFNGQTVLELTGNYYAAYSEPKMDKGARVKKTYEDVVLPILQIMIPKFPPDDSFAAFALEVSYHVRSRVVGIDTENAENLTFIVPRAAAHHLITAATGQQQQAALLDSEIYLNAEPFLLWLTEDHPADVVARKSSKRGTVDIASLSAPPVSPVMPAPDPSVSSTLLNNQPAIRLITPSTLAHLNTAHADAVARMVRNLDPQAHFVSYAPPMFVAFHQGAYLQLSIDSPLKSGEGSRYQLASLAFDDHIAHLIRPVLAYFPQTDDFDGFNFSTTLKLPGGDSSEAVEFFLPYKALVCFANYDCTGQQLIDTGIVLINGERASLNLQTAEAINRK